MKINNFFKSKAIILIVIISILTVCNYTFSESRTSQRIISLAPYITEDIYLLGAENNLIGCTTYGIYPPQAKEKERVATAVEVNVEKVLSLDPDLILASDLINKQDVRKMKNLGLKVVSFSYADDFQTLCKQFLKIGRLIGKENKASKIIKAAQNELKSIQRLTIQENKPKVFLQIGTNPLRTAPKGSFLNDFIKFSGGINIVESLRNGNYSKEQVLAKNPDYIFITTMGMTGEKEKRRWQKFKTLKAVRNNNIYMIDSRRICSPTPVTFVEIVKKMADILHNKQIN